MRHPLAGEMGAAVALGTVRGKLPGVVRGYLLPLQYWPYHGSPVPLGENPGHYDDLARR